MVLESRRKEIVHPDAIMTIQISLLEMTVVRPRKPKSLQLSMARPRRLSRG